MSQNHQIDEHVNSPEEDARLYVPINDTDNIEVSVKTSSSKEYCFSKFLGQEHFHLLMHGEIYVMNGHDMYCLDCAIRHGFLTTDRLNWQHQKK